MKKTWFISDGTYKANLHCHTTHSDGKHTPEEIKRIYQEQGYSIVAFTDHDVLTPLHHLTDENFLALCGFEVAINETAVNSPSSKDLKTYHFNFYGTRPDMEKTPPLPQMAYDDLAGINRYIADRIEEGYLACYNHPYWSLQTYEDYARLEGLFAMEIYNHNCEVEDGFCGYHPQVYDEMLRSGMRLFCLSTDDNHNAFPRDSPYYDSFGGFVQINSKSLGYEDVIDALKQGDFYASQGPEIYEISLEGRQLLIRCSPCQSIKVYTQGRKCFTIFGEALTEARFELTGQEAYVRVVCQDKDKKEANSNAYWLNKR